MYINLTTINLCPTSGGGGGTKPETTFSVEPTTQTQTVTPREGYVFSGGTVSAVTSSIDSNIQASNIKDGVEILGVLGTYIGGITPTGTIPISTNGTYDVTSYASAQVAVGGKDYRNQNGTIPGLADLGWDADSIGYYQVNNPHYPWQNSDYTVTQANKDLYGVVNKNNKGDYQNNADMEYVPMFDTTGVTDMVSYFFDFSHIKGIPLLDTSSVTDMANMFYNCSSLTTIPLLDTNKVTSMGAMFQGCSSLTTIPLLDTSSVENMSSMFYGCSSLTTIPLLDTSSVENMSSMFYGCSSLTTIPLLDTNKVTDMTQMFADCSKLTTIPALDTSKVTSMISMFSSCFSLTTVPTLDTSKVTNMSSMFGSCFSLTTVNGIDFSSMTAAPDYFLSSAGSTVTRFIVNGKIDFTWNDDYGLNRLTAIDFDSVKSILQAMSRTTNTNAKTMKFNRVMADQNGELAALIADCQTKGWTITGLVMPTGDPVIHYTSKDGNIVTPNQLPPGLTVVSNVYQDGVGTITFNDYPAEIGDYMYYGCTQLDTIEIPDEVTSIGHQALSDCGLTRITIPSTVVSIGNYTFFNSTSLVEVVMESTVPPTLSPGVFEGHNADLVIRVPLSAVNTYKTASFWSYWADLIVGYGTLQDIGWDSQSISYYGNQMVTSANAALYGVVDKDNKGNYQSNTDMEYVPMFDTTGVTDMSSYFNGFSHIKGLPILDTSSVTNMGGMFEGCSSLTTIPLLGTGGVTNMRAMFSNCSSLTTIPALDTSSVTDMRSMFYGCSSLTTIPLLDTSSVENMSNMFGNCSSLTTIPLLDTSSVTGMGNMFNGCSSLTTIPALDTSSVTGMRAMFSDCFSLTTIPALDTSSVTGMDNMFYFCSNLTTVNGIDFSSMTAAPNYFLYYAGYNVTRFIVNGKIDFTWNDDYGLNSLTKIDFDSIKSILQAMSRTTNTDAKTMKLNRTIADQNGELAALVTDCQTKGWTITGLTIQ